MNFLLSAVSSKKTRLIDTFLLLNSHKSNEGEDYEAGKDRGTTVHKTNCQSLSKMDTC